MIEFPTGGKTNVEQILKSEEMNPKKRTVKITLRDPSRKGDHMSNVI